MTNAARKCFIARQSRLTPTSVSSAVFCARSRVHTSEIRMHAASEERRPSSYNECRLQQRDRRPRPLEILSSSAVNREVGSFASSEVNRALKATATFLPLPGGACFLSVPPRVLTPLYPVSCSSMRTGSSSATLEESNKASRHDAAAGLLRCT